MSRASVKTESTCPQSAEFRRMTGWKRYALQRNSFRHRDQREKYPFLAALLILSLFTFSVRMHERYLYPGLILLLLAYVYRPVKSIWLCYGSFSLLRPLLDSRRKFRLWPGAI